MSAENKLRLKLITAFFVMLVFSFAEPRAGIRPFAISLFLGLVFAGCNIIYVCPMYIASALIARPAIETFAEISSPAVVLMLIALIKAKTKKAPPIKAVGAISLISQAGYIYVALKGGTGTAEAIISVILGAVFSYIFLVAGKKFFSSSKARLNQSELICCALCLCVFALGLSSMSDYGIFIARGASAFLVLLLIHSLGVSYGLSGALMFALGIALRQGDPSVVGTVAIATLACTAFFRINRIFAVLSVFLTELSCALYFEYAQSYIFMNLIWLAVACALFFALPPKVYKTISEYIKGESPLDSGEYIAESLKKEISGRLYEISKAYRDADSILACINAPVLETDIVELTVQRLPKKLCPECKNYLSCHKSMPEETAESFRILTRSAFERGKANISCVPHYLTSKCPRIDSLLQYINDSLSEASLRSKLSDLKREQRELLGIQMEGVASSINMLASKMDKGLKINSSLEETLSQELLYCGYETKHIRILETAGALSSVAVCLKRGVCTQSILKSNLQKFFKTRLAPSYSSAHEDADSEEFVFVPAPQFDLLYGVRNTQKWGTSKSGDTHTIVKLDCDKVLMALCDGMGSGTNAESFSANTIGLIESLYRAGLESSTILALANKILSLKSEEIFSAIDICIINLSTGVADFIKLGSSYGMIKSAGGTEIVSSGSLPLGILDSVRPVVCSKKLSDGDIVILASDGITDVFETPADYARLLEENKTLNPSELSKKILDFAVKADSFTPHDDMTVVTARIVR